MRANSLPEDVLPALMAAAEAVVAAMTPGATFTPSEVAIKAENGVTEVDEAAAAEMAAGWCRTLAAVPRFGSTADYAMGGLAAAVVLSSSPRCAHGADQASLHGILTDWVRGPCLFLRLILGKCCSLEDL